MSLKQFITTLKIARNILILITIIIVMVFIKDIYYYVLAEKNTFYTLINLEFNIQNETSKNKLIEIGKFLGLKSLFLIIQLVIMNILFILFYHIPIATSIFKNAYDRKELSPTLARYLTNHYRHNRNVRIRELLKFNSLALQENYYFSNHLKNSNLTPIFEKYDENYKQDYEFLNSKENN